MLDTNGNEASGTLTGLAAYVSTSPDLSVWVAASGSPTQDGGGIVHVDLTDAEAAGYWAVKFTSSRTDIADCIVRFGNREVICLGGVGEPTERCQRSGILFPVSRIREDGLGRRVGDLFYIDTVRERTTPDV